MSSQRRTIMGACDYSIATLQQIKKDLGEIGNPNELMNWSIGGMVITMVSHLIQVCDKVLKKSVESGQGSAASDLKTIQDEFNIFFECMLNNNS